MMMNAVGAAGRGVVTGWACMTQVVARALQGALVTNNSALGEAGGGAAGSGLGGGIFVQPACQGGAGCRSAYALLNGTLLDGNNASQVRVVTGTAYGITALHYCTSATSAIFYLNCGLQAGGGVYFAPDATALASFTMVKGGIRGNSVPVGPETFGGEN